MKFMKQNDRELEPELKKQLLVTFNSCIKIKRRFCHVNGRVIIVLVGGTWPNVTAIMSSFTNLLRTTRVIFGKLETKET